MQRSPFSLKICPGPDPPDCRQDHCALSKSQRVKLFCFFSFVLKPCWCSSRVATNMKPQTKVSPPNPPSPPPRHCPSSLRASSPVALVLRPSVSRSLSAPPRESGSPEALFTTAETGNDLHVYQRRIC